MKDIKSDAGQSEKQEFKNQYSDPDYGSGSVASFTQGRQPIVFRSSLVR
jgi:hypothetical protein